MHHLPGTSPSALHQLPKFPSSDLSCYFLPLRSSFLLFPSFGQVSSALLCCPSLFGFFSFHRISTSIVSSNVAVFLKVERADSFAVSAFSSDENRSKRLAAKVSARHTGNSNRRSEQEGGFRGRSLPLPPFLRSAIP